MSQRIDDIRYSELLFLLSFPGGGNVTRGVSGVNPQEWESVRLTQTMYIDMVATLLEELYIRFENNSDQTIIGRLRGELDAHFKHYGIPEDIWSYPREGLRSLTSFSAASAFCLSHIYSRASSVRSVLRAWAEPWSRPSFFVENKE